MDDTLNKLRTGVALALDNATSMDEVASRISALKEQGMLPVAEQVNDFVEFLGVVNKQDSGNSKLKVRSVNTDLMSASYRFLNSIVRKYMDPSDPNYLLQNANWDDPYIDYYLDDIWKREPILSGAVYSMSAKMSALEWTITGGKSVAKKYARMFSSAAHMGGYSWDGFISSTCQDFYTANRGAFWETPKKGNAEYGRLADLGHIDALTCTLTGNTEYPIWYLSEVTGQSIHFKPGEFIHFASMPSARESRLGSGFCAVARALNAAQMIIRLHNYDMEKMNNLPPEGVAAVTGLTYEELNDAFVLWQTERKSNSSLTYPQVLWLLSSVPGAEVKVDIQSFSQLPESFDRNVVIEQYVNLIALVFGVDAREFWPISTSSMGTAAESEIQHLKAKGKGHGEFISIVERHLNGELEDGVDFAFDTQDIDEDLKSAAVAKAWIDAYLPLIGQGAGGKQPAAGATSNMEEPMPGQPQGGSSSANSVEIITKDQLKRLLADKGVLPDYMVLDDRIAIRDSDVHMKDLYYDDEYDRYPEDVSCYRWKGGTIKRERIPGITLWTKPNGNILPAEVIKDIKQESLTEELPKRNIRGNPIPDKEATRGTIPTKTTIRDENERWRANEVLAKYAITEEEIDELTLPEARMRLNGRK